MARALQGKPLGDRARMGAAIAKLLAGDAAGAEAALEGLANDTTFSATLRGEAAFHLAVLVRDAGRPAAAMKWTELALSVDSTGLWAQRALQLRSTLPPAPAEEATPAPSAAATAPAGDAAAAPAAAAAAEEASAGVSFPAPK